MKTRHSTKYPGVFFREAARIGGCGLEKVYYIVFKKDGKYLEEKAGRQFADDMTPAKAANIRAERIENKRKSPKEKRELIRQLKEEEANRWTVSKLWSEYKIHNPRVKSIATDDSRFQLHIEPGLGEKEPKDLCPLDVDRLRLNLLKKRAPGTVKNVLELLRRIINFGTKKHLCQGLSFVIEMPKANNIKTEDLSPDELARLMEVIDSEIRNDGHIIAACVMKMVLCTGMRRSEMFRLKWRDIDFFRGFIFLRDPKGGVDQKIPLNNSAKKILDTLRQTGSDFVFPGRDGKQRSDIKRPVNRIKKEAGLPDDFRALHGLRHVYASMLASSGQVDMYTLQKLLTHKSPQMTQRYAHLRDDRLQQAAELAGDIIDGVINGNGATIASPFEKQKK